MKHVHMEISVFYKIYLEYLLKYLCEQGMSTEQALMKCSFTSDVLPQSISDTDLQQILQNVESSLKLSSFQVGFNLGFQLGTTDHGIVGLASLCSETVAQSLQTYSDYFQIISPVFKLICSEEDPYFISESICDKDISPSTYNFLMALGLANAGIIGLNSIKYDARKIQKKLSKSFKIEVGEHPEPNKKLWKLFEPVANITYGHNSTKLKISLRASQQKMLSANAQTRAAMIQLCESELEKNQVDFISDIKRKIKSQLKKPLTAEQFSKSIAISERTFHRKLTKYNTSYGKLCLQIKHKEAKTFLEEKNLSIKEIAYVLGYSEVTNFSSAFKKYEGQPPKKYRDNFK